MVGTPLVQALTGRMALAQEDQSVRRAGIGEGGYGELQATPDRRDGVERIALPAGFTYRSFGIEGDPMTDGNPTPRAHDGMGVFDMPNGNVRLVRNHEDRDPAVISTPIGDPSKAYDARAMGGNTTLEVAVTSDGDRELVRDFVSLNGTIVNCAGGSTPWGSWLSCEETTAGETQGFEKDHGYNFEIPASANDEVTPVPLKAMGRFVHEAAAIDPRTGIVYETEDRGTSGFYRFIPNVAGDLAQGGRLQMLAVRNRPNYDTRTGQVVGQSLPVVWVDIDDPDPAAAEINSLAVFEQGAAEGAATFARLEGCWYGGGTVFFNATSGGDSGDGQVWAYRISGRSTGQLRLLFESPDPTVLSGPDNITVSPRGGVLVCEDGDNEDLFLRGLTRNGKIFDFARNLFNGREWCGATYTSDGETLYVNVQGDTRSGGPGNLGYTFAIWGPWEDGAL